MRNRRRLRFGPWAASLLVGVNAALVLSGCFGAAGEAPGEVLDGCGSQRIQAYVSGVEQGPALMVRGAVGYSSDGIATVSGATAVENVSEPEWAPYWSGRADEDSGAGSYRLVAVDADGAELASLSFDQPAKPTDLNAPANADVTHSIPYCAALPLASPGDVSGVAGFRLLANERVAASVAVASGSLESGEAGFVASKGSLQVFGVTGRVSESGQGSVSWSVRGGADDVSYAIRYRPSGAAPWREVAVGEYPSHATHATVEVEPPTGEGAAFEVVAADGTLEVSATSPPFGAQG